jgi:hypothetical protein
MKIPEKKRKELEKKGKHKSPPVRGGGAMGRLRQFEKARGLNESSAANPADDQTRKKKTESD